MFKDKGLIIGVVITILLVVGGVFYFSQPNVANPIKTPVSQNILVSKESTTTSGFVNGNYLPATDSAKLSLVEFGDYECPACGVYHPFIKKLLTDYSDKINFTFRNFPLSQHKNAPISSQAVEAAGLQGKYWQMHDKIFETQAEWSASGDAKSIFVGYAEALGLDVNKFKSDIDSATVKNKITADTTDGNLVKLQATPTYYLNGVQIDPLPSTYDLLKNRIEAELAK